MTKQLITTSSMTLENYLNVWWGCGAKLFSWCVNRLAAALTWIFNAWLGGNCTVQCVSLAVNVAFGVFFLLRITGCTLVTPLASYFINRTICRIHTSFQLFRVAPSILVSLLAAENMFAVLAFGAFVGSVKHLSPSDKLQCLYLLSLQILFVAERSMLSILGSKVS